jgi:hypothetical protein
MTRFRAELVALKESPSFEGPSRRQLARLARLSENLDMPAGTVLARRVLSRGVLAEMTSAQ